MEHTSPEVRPSPLTSTPQRYAPPFDYVSPTGAIIVVRLASRYPGDTSESLLALAESQTDLAALKSFLITNRLTVSTRLIRCVTTRRLELMEAAAEEAVASIPELRELPEAYRPGACSLLQYWRLDARAALDANPSLDLSLLAIELSGVPGVGTAYLELDATPAGFSFDPSDDAFYPDQTYLKPPDPLLPGGIRAKAIWDLGYFGEEVALVDVERGWFLDHLDLQRPTPIGTIPGDKYDFSDMSHGASVLGICAAVDNGFGIVGIAPNLESLTVVSVLRDGQLGVNYSDAIVRAIENSNPGDVILLELHVNELGSYYPAESVDDVFLAILLASALGRVVIEAAGNGKYRANIAKPRNFGLDLDAYTNAGGVHVFDRAVRDSGAVLVAASDAGPDYFPLEESNFGHRIDCFAPGWQVRTCTFDATMSGAAQSAYEPYFSGTSAASAIVAGAAVLLQSTWKQRTGSVLSPFQVRKLLSDPLLNTEQGASSSFIGFMPDLGAIVDANLPDVYLRDNEADTGVLPSDGVLCASPDIIVLPAADAAPALNFIPGADNELVGGSNYRLYARLRNRGGTDALGAKVTFYWSPPSTLITPDLWNLIGTTPPFDVLSGDLPTMSAPVDWPAAQLPVPGHYCFIGIAEHPQDMPPVRPASLALPPPIASTAWDRFLGLIRNNNNIAWRNFNVIDLPTAPLQPLALPFAITGDPDHLRAFTIRVDFPPIPVGRAILRVPADLGSQLRHSARVQGHPSSRVQELELKSRGGLREQRILIPAGQRYECEIVLEPPFGHVRRRKTIVISQSYKGLEVGRITWELPQR